MRTLVTRVVGALLALLGLAAAATGVWLVSSLGSSGTATFTAEPGSRVVVLDPQVLNRVDHPVEVTASSDADGRLWAGVARPSDVEALLGDGERQAATGVDVPSWTLETTGQGEGESVDPSSLDVWQRATGGEGSITTTIDQDQAPQTLVVAAPEGAELSEVTMTVADDGWFTKSLALLLLGLALLALGVGLLVRSRRGGDDADEVDAESEDVHDETREPDAHDDDTRVLDAPGDDTTETRPVPARTEEEHA